MKKLVLLTLTPLLLGACGQLGGTSRTSIGVSTNDAASQVTVTKTVTAPVVDDKGAVTKPGSTTYSSGVAGAVKFVFTARPGSDAAYITGYRITRYVVNDKDVTSNPLIEEKKMNLYVGSGYDCAERTATESCRANSTDLRMANGLPSAEFGLNFAGALAALVQATEQSASSSVDLEFLGVSSNGTPVLIPVTGINSNANFTVVNN